MSPPQPTRGPAPAFTLLFHLRVIFRPESRRRFADSLEKLVVADQGAGFLGQRILPGGAGRAPEVERRGGGAAFGRFQEVSGGGICVQERFDADAQRFVIPARGRQVARPPGGVGVTERLVEDRLDRVFRDAQGVTPL